MNVFEAVKQNLTTRQAAEMYGIPVSRHGMAVCPFHNDKNPSMKVDKRFHCFACQADGDAVDFVSRLFGLPGKEAAMKLADDFSIPYDARKKASIRPKIRAPTPEQRYRQEENRCYKVLSDYFHHLRTWKRQYAPQQPEDEWHPHRSLSSEKCWDSKTTAAPYRAAAVFPIPYAAFQYRKDGCPIIVVF